MKRVISGYVSLFRESVGLPNDGSFLVPPANPLVLILILGIIGSIRNVLSIALDAPAFYSFDGDILWTSFFFPVQLCLLPGALLDWQLRKLGYRHLAAESIFGLSFYLQGLHLIIPFVDAAGFALGIPAEYEIFANSIRSEWYTNVLHMSPGILFGWWVTAFVTAKVLRRRLGISWPALLLAGATTYAVILIPTYFMFPALNTLFNRTWGPYLWNPLAYLFIYPKWFPFWGYAWWFTLSAVPGLIYFVRNSSSEQTRAFFSVNTAARAHIWLVCIASARYYLDTVWSPGLRIFPWPFALLNYIVYLYMLYLFIPSIAGFLLHRMFGKPLDTVSVLRQSVLVWIVYPMVPIISMATRSAALSTIEGFRFIPSFMTENNFLPVGMIAVIPVLLLFYTRLISRNSGAGWLQSFGAALVALLVIYVLFYQYVDNLFFNVLGPYGPVFAMGLYTLCFLAPLFFAASRFHVAFGPQRMMLPHLVWAAALLSVALMAVGLISFLSAR